MKFRLQSVDLLQMYDNFLKTDTFRMLFSRYGLQFVISAGLQYPGIVFSTAFSLPPYKKIISLLLK